MPNCIIQGHDNVIHLVLLFRQLRYLVLFGNPLLDAVSVSAVARLSVEVAVVEFDGVLEVD